MVTDNKDPLELRWTVLDHLLKKLIKSYEVPQEVIQNLQYARALTNFYKDDPTEPDRAKELPRIDSLFNEVEQTLLDIAQIEGEDFVKDWEKKLFDASQGKEVFKNVEKLKSLGLDVPQDTELAYELRKMGIEISDDVLTDDECFDEIIRILGETKR